MKHLFLILVLLTFSVSLISNSGFKSDQQEAVENQWAYKWADEILDTMCLQGKIGQLIMVDGYSGEFDNELELEELVKKHQIGGVIFFKGHPHRQVDITNKLQTISPVPLFIAMDAEWGVSMRLDSVPSFPNQMTLGAIQDNTLIYEMGEEIANQCIRL